MTKMMKKIVGTAVVAMLLSDAPVSAQMAGYGQAPLVATTQSQVVSGDTLIFTALVNPNGSETNVWFQYGPDQNTQLSTQAQAIGAGTVNTTYVASVQKVTAGKTYYFRAVAQNGFTRTVGELRSVFVSGSNTIISTNPYIGYQNNSYAPRSVGLRVVPTTLQLQTNSDGEVVNVITGAGENSLRQQYVHSNTNLWAVQTTGSYNQANGTVNQREGSNNNEISCAICNGIAEVASGGANNTSKMSASINNFFNGSGGVILIAILIVALAGVAVLIIWRFSKEEIFQTVREITPSLSMKKSSSGKIDLKGRIQMV